MSAEHIVVVGRGSLKGFPCREDNAKGTSGREKNRGPCWRSHVKGACQEEGNIIIGIRQEAREEEEEEEPLAMGTTFRGHIRGGAV